MSIYIYYIHYIFYSIQGVIYIYVYILNRRNPSKFCLDDQSRTSWTMALLPPESRKVFLMADRETPTCSKNLRCLLGKTWVHGYIPSDKRLHNELENPPMSNSWVNPRTKSPFSMVI